MVRAYSHFENAIFHSNIIRNFLKNKWNRSSMPNPPNVMDIGCGSGKILTEELVPALPKNFSELVGVDKYHSMIDYCRTLNTDPRISFEQLDITTKDVPKKFLGRFDIITSFFCLHYAEDYNQAIRNIQYMLKPSGDLIYLQTYNVNILYECYRKLCKIDIWKPFLKEFEGYADHFSGSDRDSKIENIFRENNLKLLSYEFTGLPYKTIPNRFQASLQAFDIFESMIPEDQRSTYLKDFHKCFCEVLGLDYTKEDNLDRETEVILECLTVHAKKP